VTALVDSVEKMKFFAIVVLVASLCAAIEVETCVAARVSTKTYEKDDGATLEVTREHRLGGYYVNAVYTKP